MGLAASQGRYLCLTARMSDLVFEGQQISHQRLALATETQAISKKYTEAMNNKVMKATTPEGGTQELTYDILTSQDPFSGLCMRIVDVNGDIVVPHPAKEYMEVKSKDADGNDVINSYYSVMDFLGDISNYNISLTDEEKEEMTTWELPKLKEHLMDNSTNPDITFEIKSDLNTSLKTANERYLFDENCKDPKYLHEMLTTGQWMLQQVSTEDEGQWENVVWQGQSSISEVYDTSDDAAAEAEYEAAMTELQKRDKLLELRLEQVQTQEKAVEKELESVKEIISKNIDDSFKTFA